MYVDNTRYHKVFCNGNALMSLARHHDTLGNMSGQWSWGASQGTSWATASKPYARSLPKKLKEITDSFKAMN